LPTPRITLERLTADTGGLLVLDDVETASGDTPVTSSGDPRGLRAGGPA
jgi:hypothetical protein